MSQFYIIRRLPDQAIYGGIKQVGPLFPVKWIEKLDDSYLGCLLFTNWHDATRALEDTALRDQGTHVYITELHPL